MSRPMAGEKVWLKRSKYSQAEKKFYENKSQNITDCVIEPVNRSLVQPILTKEKVWLRKARYDEAETKFYEKLTKLSISLALSEPIISTIVREQVWLQKKVYADAEKNYYEKLAKLSMTQALAEPIIPTIIQERVWLQKKVYADAERNYYEKLAKSSKTQKALLEPVISIIKQDKVWLQKQHYLEAEKRYYEKLAKGISTNVNCKNSLASEVAKARQHIKNSLECIDDIAAIAANNVSVDINNRLNTLEKEKSDLMKQLIDLTALVGKLELRLSKLENSNPTTTSSSTMTHSEKVGTTAPPPTPKQEEQKKEEDDDDDGVDLFGSDSEEEDTEAAKIKEQRLAEYAARKSKKPVLIAKSNIILDVKPWDDETDMKEMEQHVRKVTSDGLVWGASKLVPLAFGIHKLQISCVVEDDKVSVDWLQETIQEIEDYVQSVDIAAFNKV